MQKDEHQTDDHQYLQDVVGVRPVHVPTPFGIHAQPALLRVARQRMNTLRAVRGLQRRKPEPSRPAPQRFARRAPLAA